jgi:BMFP domain-containing protein YqiC
MRREIAGVKARLGHRPGLARGAKGCGRLAPCAIGREGRKEGSFLQRAAAMNNTRNPILDDMARLMTDAAGLAQGVRREAETVMRTQLERLMSTMDVVTREEFEAVRDMAILAREENERLEARIAALEEKLSAKGA